MNYDVIIVGAGPGGIFSAYELVKEAPHLKVAVFEAGHALEKRRCPIDGDKVKSCISCKTCSIMSGFGGAGAVAGVVAAHDSSFLIDLLAIMMRLSPNDSQCFDRKRV